MKRKVSKFIVMCLVATLTIPQCVQAQETTSIQYGSKFEKNASYPIRFNKGGNYDHDINFNIDVYGNSERKLYTISDIGDDSATDKKEAYKLFNEMLKTGDIEEAVVDVTAKYKTFSGSIYDDDQSNYLGYSWAEYYAGDCGNGGTDKTWGGSSACWASSGTPKYIYISQTHSLNVTNADVSLSINWSAGADTSIGGSVTLTETQTSSKCTWTSNQCTNVTVLGAEYGETEFSSDDLCGGNVTSCVNSDKGYIYYGSTIYKPSTQIRFTNSL